MTAKSFKTIIVNRPIDSVMPEIERALIKVGCSIVSVDKQNGEVLARKGMSFTSWGEKISVIAKSTDNGCIIVIGSVSVPSTTLIDWGTNSKNISNFEMALWDFIG